MAALPLGSRGEEGVGGCDEEGCADGSGDEKTVARDGADGAFGAVDCDDCLGQRCDDCGDALRSVYQEE